MTIVRNEAEFNAAILSLEPDIIVADDINLTSSVRIGYPVSIRGETDGFSLFWSNPQAVAPSMLVVSESGQLTVGALTLDAENRDGTLVRVDGGTFTMDEGATLQNIRSTTAQVAVKIGDLSTPVGGAFIMNGGLITGVESGDSAVFCSGGTMVMDNSAEISGNINSGVTLTDTIAGGVKSTLTMRGNARISNNRCTLSGGSGGAGRILGSDVIMGVNEGDAPIVTENESIGSCGGFIFSSGVVGTNRSSLTMRYGASISGNTASELAGAVGGTSFDVVMGGNASMKNNRCEGNIGGLMLSTNSTAVLSGFSEISGNTTPGLAGGVYLNREASLQMEGRSSIHGNSAAAGAGIYLTDTTNASLGTNNSLIEIYSNKAENNGGGVFIALGGSLDMMGRARITGNTATNGKGVYKEGELTLSGSIQILDGLFFEDLQADSLGTGTEDEPGSTSGEAWTRVEPDGRIQLAPLSMTIQERAHSDSPKIMRFGLNAKRTAYSANVPVIAGALTNRAKIRLEQSNYVSLPNVTLVIADKGEGYAQLGEDDRAAWILPSSFGKGYSAILSSGLNQVLIGLEVYNITYRGLLGEENNNPASYDISALPITLVAPGRRDGYAFAGWYDSKGKRVTEISAGMAEHVSLTAVWEKLSLLFDANAPCACNMPEPIPAVQDKNIAIPMGVPYRRYYRFICWSTLASGGGKMYFPGDLVSVTEKEVTLYAQWQPVCCCTVK